MKHLVLSNVYAAASWDYESAHMAPHRKAPYVAFILTGDIQTTAPGIRTTAKVRETTSSDVTTTLKVRETTSVDVTTTSLEDTDSTTGQ